MRLNPLLCTATAGTFVLASTVLAGGPPNNTCDGGLPIFDGQTAFSTVGATTDGPALPPECEEGFGLSLVNDIWFNYTATCDGVITVSTCNAATYDTRLAAYTGPCSSLTLVACNDDGPGCATFTSIMEWFGDEGTLYRIRVGGFGGSGTGTLTVSCGTATTSDCCFANGTPGCDDAACEDTVCLVDSICCSAGWDASCAALALVFCDALCTGGGGTCPPSDHDCFTTGGPGCTDIACCEAVCAADPFCCDVAWDGICVAGAVATCGGGEPGSCPPSDHDCFTTGGPGCTDEKCCVAVCAFDPFCCDVAWDALCVSGATATCNLEPVANDDCEDAIEIFLGDTAFTTLGATTDGPALPPECDKGFGLSLVNDVWFVFTGTENDILSVSTCNQATYDTRLAAYTGDCNNLTLVGCNDDAPGCAGLTSIMLVLTDVGEEYLIRVGGFGGSGTGTLSLFYGAAPGLENDDCADATEIFLGDTAFTTVGATTDGPPLPAECDKGFGLSFVNDVWFVFTGTQNDILTVSTCNQASFDTRLAAYTGACNKLALVACNDDGPGCAGFTSIMEVLTSVGQEYLIRVGGFGGSGTGTLTLFYGQEPGLPNDDCEDAIVISDGVTAFSTVGATTDGPPLPAACDKGFGLSFVNDVWYLYTPTCDGLITVSTCNSATYDTRLAAYTGDCNNLTLVACNDDGPGCAGFTSIMEWQGQCGVTYLVRVGGFGGSGTGQMLVSCDGAPCGKGDPCPWDLDGDDSVGGADLGELLNQWGPCPGCSADFNNDGEVNGADLGELLNNWGACP